MSDKEKQDAELLKKLLDNLDEIREKLVYANNINGNLAKYKSIKKEIQEIGWDGICMKYHPDINIGDPAAYELFRFYKFVYDTMDRK